MTTSAVQSVVTDGAAAGCRAIDVRVEGGIDLRILPDRGFDLGDAWFRGRRIAWISAVGETRWLGDFPRSFGGGLVTTCGLDNVGAASEGVGLHGTYSSLAARDVYVERDDEGVNAGAVMLDADSLEQRHLRVERSVFTGTGAGYVDLEDRTVNVGTADAEAPVLYHVNLLWNTVDIDSDEVIPRDDVSAAQSGWRERPATDRTAPERVYEHVGATRAVVSLGDIRITLRWNLPRLWQWVHPALGVLGLEPANCSVLGRAHDRAEGRLPVLEPGDERQTRIEIHAELGSRR